MPETIAGTESSGAPHGPPGGMRPRGRLGIAILVVLVVVVASVAGVGLWRREPSPPPVAAQVRCGVHWQPSDRVQPTHAGDVVVAVADPPPGENVHVLEAGDMTFEASAPNISPMPRGPGSDLVIRVFDANHRRIHQQLFQIWQGPTNEFAGDTGFTGLVYVTDPEVGAIVQFTCAAE